jgi:rsbT co-antagonist protein RsbR
MPVEGSEQLADRLVEQAPAVLERWAAGVSPAVRAQTSAAELQAELDALYQAFVAGVRAGGGTRGEAFGELRALLGELSISRARRGFSPTDTAGSVFALKTALYASLGDDRLADYLELAAAIDDLGLFTFERFVSARDAVIVNQTEQLLELSTPVVKIWDGVLAVPLVGTLDSARTQVVMETLLQMLVDTGSAHAIIDITGVAAVDTQVAQHLLKTVVAARLMGAECIISGIRPQIAQTVVGLGIEFGDIPTRASLADALRHVLSQAGFEIVRRSRQAP